MAEAGAPGQACLVTLGALSGSSLCKWRLGGQLGRVLYRQEAGFRLTPGIG